MSGFTLSQEILKELLTYNPDTGIFTWKRRDRKWFPSEGSWKIWNARYAEATTGSLDNNGYPRIVIFGKLYRAHRLAFLYMDGSFPSLEVDHIDRNPGNNKFDNLRAVTHSINNRNRVKADSDNSTGFLGVHYHRRTSKFVARILADGHNKGLGYFDTAEEAHAAYLAAKKIYHPGAVL